jgi:hypothetical protein
VTADWDHARQPAIAVLDENDRLQHIYDLAGDRSQPADSAAELLFRY